MTRSPILKLHQILADMCKCYKAVETVLDTRKALHQLILTTTLQGKKPAEARFIDEQIKAQES